MRGAGGNVPAGREASALCPHRRTRRAVSPAGSAQTRLRLQRQTRGCFWNSIAGYRGPSKCPEGTRIAPPPCACQQPPVGSPSAGTPQGPDAMTRVLGCARVSVHDLQCPLYGARRGRGTCMSFANVGASSPEFGSLLSSAPRTQDTEVSLHVKNAKGEHARDGWFCSPVPLAPR